MSARGIHAIAAVAAAGLAATAGTHLAVTSGTHVDLDAFAAAAGEVLAGRTVYAEAAVPFVYPPAGVLLALVALSGPIAWTVLSLVALARVAWLLVGSAWPGLPPGTGRTRSCWVFAALALLQPTLLCLAFGQVGLLLLWMVVEGALGRPDSPRSSLIGVATAMKLTPAYLLVILAAAGRWRTVIWSLGGALVVTATVGVVWPGVVADYLTGGWRLALTVNTTIDAQNHSVAGLFRVLGNPAAWVIGVAVVVAALAGVLAVRSLKRGDALGGIAVALVGGLLVSPISWTHHWVAVYPALVLLLREATAGRRPALVLLVVAAAGLAFWADVLGRDGAHTLAPGERWPLAVVLQQQWIVLWGLAFLAWFLVASAYPHRAGSVCRQEAAQAGTIGV